jgi:hypothetical protein
MKKVYLDLSTEHYEFAAEVPNESINPAALENSVVNWLSLQQFIKTNRNTFIAVDSIISFSIREE